ncbi:C1q-like domain-containing protein [Pedobacter xixiisoli]|uniref:C1q domain-containing protein n=1 Tax=Pedobacter xixiisoli TaxID=1476464 RepID=A0A286AEB7_9SPHI|nr:hypothetical protein [Pedobacter xixiisoli]SOD20217.1 C1q domain-containing protein [Pedobacter xixiisoli]
MRKLFTLIILGVAFGAKAQNVGVNTTDPKATLQVVGAPGTAGIPDGIIPPKLTRAQLIAKTGYGTDQIGAIVYVTDLSGTTNAATASVLQIGHYSFDGTKWNNMLIPKFTGFLATRNTNYTFGGGTPSKLVVYPTSTDNPNGWYNTANGRFTPQVAGYYQFNAALRIVSSTGGEKVILLAKNGIDVNTGVSLAGSNYYMATVSAVIYLNGTTDYVDVRCYADNALTDIVTTPITSFFQGYLVGQ